MNIESINFANSVITKLKTFYNLDSDIALAEKLGISKGTLSNWKTRDSLDLRLILEKCPGVNLNWLLLEGAQIVDDSKNSNAEISIAGPLVMNVPIISSYAYAGYLAGFADPEYYENLPTMPFAVDREYKGRYVAFEVRGESMNDGSINSYLPGDIVLCREVQKIHWQNKLHIDRWDFVIVHNYDGVLIKKITYHNPVTGDITAHSLNSMYEDINMNLKDVWQLFNVVRVERNK